MPQAPKYEPLSPDHWEKIPPPVDQGLWKRFMNEEDSDSDASDTEQEEEMAGPSSTSKGSKGEASDAKPTTKNDLIKDILNDSFNEMIYNILDGLVSADDCTTTTASKEANLPSEKPKDSQPSQPPTEKGTTSALGVNSSSSSSAASKPTKEAPFPADVEICHTCNLPRLKHPRIGITARPPPDPTAQYCANEPPIVLNGHDVHGNAFPGFKPKPNPNTTAAAAAAAASSASSKTTKSKAPTNPKADKKSAGAAAADTTTSPPTLQDSPPPSSETTSNNNNNNANAPAPTTATSTEYPQIRTPQLKCPNNCGQWKAVNVMAKHLDSCLLGKGRRAGREARERMGASGTGTPGEGGSGSRAGTPKLGGGGGSGSAGVKRGREEDSGVGKGSGKKRKGGK